MARTENYTQFVCDRCGRTEFALPNSTAALTWTEITRITQAGSPTTRTLCESCAAEYQSLVKAQDAEFVAFMRGAKGGEA